MKRNQQHYVGLLFLFSLCFLSSFQVFADPTDIKQIEQSLINNEELAQYVYIIANQSGSPYQTLFRDSSYNERDITLDMVHRAFIKQLRKLNSERQKRIKRFKEESKTIESSKEADNKKTLRFDLQNRVEFSELYFKARETVLLLAYTILKNKFQADQELPSLQKSIKDLVFGNDTQKEVLIKNKIRESVLGRKFEEIYGVKNKHYESSGDMGYTHMFSPFARYTDEETKDLLYRMYEFDSVKYGFSLGLDNKKLEERFGGRQSKFLSSVGHFYASVMLSGIFQGIFTSQKDVMDTITDNIAALKTWEMHINYQTFMLGAGIGNYTALALMGDLTKKHQPVRWKLGLASYIGLICGSLTNDIIFGRIHNKEHDAILKIPDPEIRALYEKRFIENWWWDVETGTAGMVSGVATIALADGLIHLAITKAGTQMYELDIPATGFKGSLVNRVANHFESMLQEMGYVIKDKAFKNGQRVFVIEGSVNFLYGIFHSALVLMAMHLGSEFYNYVLKPAWLISKINESKSEYEVFKKTLYTNPDFKKMALILEDKVVQSYQMLGTDLRKDQLYQETKFHMENAELEKQVNKAVFWFRWLAEDGQDPRVDYFNLCNCESNDLTCEKCAGENWHAPYESLKFRAEKAYWTYRFFFEPQSPFADDFIIPPVVDYKTNHFLVERVAQYKEDYKDGWQKALVQYLLAVLKTGGFAERSEQYRHPRKPFLMKKINMKVFARNLEYFKKIKDIIEDVYAEGGDLVQVANDATLYMYGEFVEFLEKSPIEQYYTQEPMSFIKERNVLKWEESEIRRKEIANDIMEKLGTLNFESLRVSEDLFANLSTKKVRVDSIVEGAEKRIKKWIGVKELKIINVRTPQDKVHTKEEDIDFEKELKTLDEIIYDIGLYNALYEANSSKDSEETITLKALETTAKALRMAYQYRASISAVRILVGKFNQSITRYDKIDSESNVNTRSVSW